MMAPGMHQSKSVHTKTYPVESKRLTCCCCSSRRCCSTHCCSHSHCCIRSSSSCCNRPTRGTWKAQKRARKYEYNQSASNIKITGALHSNSCASADTASPLNHTNISELHQTRIQCGTTNMTVSTAMDYGSAHDILMHGPVEIKDRRLPACSSYTLFSHQPRVKQIM